VTIHERGIVPDENNGGRLPKRDVPIGSIPQKLDSRGRRSDATLQAIEARNRLLIEAVDRRFAGLSDRQAATMLHQALNRYACGAWRRDRCLDECPARYENRLTAVLWRLLKARDHTPSARSIRRTLAAFRGPAIGV
jgi:hypothetical protein